MKASDITDEAFLAAVRYCLAEREATMATRWDVAAVLAGHPEHVEGPPHDYPDMPWKVVLAKARSLIRRGLIDGCSCGCRGDFGFTAAAELAEVVKTLAADRAAAAGIPTELWRACTDATAMEMARIRSGDEALRQLVEQRTVAVSAAVERALRIAHGPPPENVTGDS